MIKKIFINKTETNKRGHYSFLDNNLEDYFYNLSDGISPEYDKFIRQDLYSYVQEESLNDKIVNWGLSLGGQHGLEIEHLKVKNDGVSHPVWESEYAAWIMDDTRYKELRAMGTSTVGGPGEIAISDTGYTAINDANPKDDAGEKILCVLFSSLGQESCFFSKNYNNIMVSSGKTIPTSGRPLGNKVLFEI